MVFRTTFPPHARKYTSRRLANYGMTSPQCYCGNHSERSRLHDRRHVRLPDPASHAAPTLRHVSESSYFPASSLSNLHLVRPSRRKLHGSFRNRMAQWPAISSRSRKVAAGSCSEWTIESCSSSDLVGADGVCRQTFLVSKGISYYFRDGKTSEMVGAYRDSDHGVSDE